MVTGNIINKLTFALMLTYLINSCGWSDENIDFNDKKLISNFSILYDTNDLENGEKLYWEISSEIHKVVLNNCLEIYYDKTSNIMFVKTNSIIQEEKFVKIDIIKNKNYNIKYIREEEFKTNNLKLIWKSIK